MKPEHIKPFIGQRVYLTVKYPSDNGKNTSYRCIIDRVADDGYLYARATEYYMFPRYRAFNVDPTTTDCWDLNYVHAIRLCKQS